MKVAVITDGSLLELSSMIAFEGDEVVNRISDGRVPDLILTDQLIKSPPAPCITFKEPIPKLGLQAWGYSIADLTEPDTTIISVSKWKRSDSSWADQTIIGFPAMGVMNEDLGKVIVSANAFRQDPHTSLDYLFHNIDLNGLLNSWAHTGFVTFLLQVMADGSCHVIEASAGIPFRGILALLECRRSRVSEFFLEEQLLLDSWSVGLHFTRSPWPFQPSAPRIFFRNPSSEARKHFWTSTIITQGKGCYCDSTILGYSTAWGNQLTDANRRALRLCRWITVPEKQFRTDIASRTMGLWNDLSALHILSPLSRRVQNRFSQSEDDHPSPVAGTRTARPSQEAPGDSSMPAESHSDDSLS